MAMPSGSEMLLIFGVVVLLFGSKKIPELAKGLGQGIRNFKNEMREDAHPPSPPKEVAPQAIETAASTVAASEKPHTAHV